MNQAVGPNGESAEFEFVTPEMAEDYLSHNLPENRNEKTKEVFRMSKEIEAGTFLLTGETIKFDRDAFLVDGANRCRAIIRAGKGAWVLVVRGLDPQAVYLIDSGIARSAADSAVIAGAIKATSATAKIGLANLYYAKEHGYFRTTAPNEGRSVSQDLTRTDRNAYMRTIPLLEEAVIAIRPAAEMVRLNRSAWGLLWILAHRVDADAAVNFFGTVASGVTNGIGDPFYALKERANKDYVDLLKAGSSNIPASRSYFYMARAWNAWRRGERVIKFDIGSAESGWAQIPELV